MCEFWWELALQAGIKHQRLFSPHFFPHFAFFTIRFSSSCRQQLSKILLESKHFIIKLSHSGAQVALVSPLATVPTGFYLWQPQFGFFGWCFSEAFWRLSTGRLSFHQWLSESSFGSQQVWQGFASLKLCLSSKHSWQSVQERLSRSITYCNKVQRKPHKWTVPKPWLAGFACNISNHEDEGTVFPLWTPWSSKSQLLLCRPGQNIILHAGTWQTLAAPEPEMGKEVRRIQASEVCCSQRCCSSESLFSLAKLSGKSSSHRTKIPCRLPQWLMVMQETNGILLACQKKLLTLGQDWGRIL